jgi:hypothetical protein
LASFTRCQERRNLSLGAIRAVPRAQRPISPTSSWSKAMNRVFFDKVRDVFPSALERMVGYDEAEIQKIERLYGVVISGDFSSFLRRAGRSDGGVVGDDPFIIYRNWNVRTHILFQVGFFNDLQEIGAWEYLNKPFVFSLESETQYYFLQTGLVNSDLVFHYDENSRMVKSTGLSFYEYLVGAVARYPLGGSICRGDLLEI